MDFVIWIIVIVLIVGIVWWRLNRSNSANKGSAASRRTDGGLSGGSAAASAEAAGTAGLPGAAGFGAPAEPTPPTTADEDLERSGPTGHQEPAVAPESVGERNAVEGQEADAAHEFRVAEPLEPGKTGLPAETAVTAEPSAQEARAAEETLSRQEPLAAREPQAGPERTTPDEAAARRDASSSEGSTARQAGGEWETQWSEAGGSGHSAHSTSPGPAGAAATGISATGAAATPLAESAPAPGPVAEATEGTHYVHHTEYTDPHAPTLPGAETAAADDLTGNLSDGFAGDDSATGVREQARTDDGPAARTASPAGYESAPEPIGHLAAEHPYGAGSASPGPDGSGPADYAVKGDAGAMVYYEEGHPDYEQTTAEVWFESAAHAEAAGFRAPRRTRL
jgi:hypothetical protein